MKTSQFYIEHEGKVAEAGSRFEHVMAVALDPRADYKKGVIRCILSREGDVAVSGYIDRSALYEVHGDSLDRFVIGNKINIAKEEEIIARLEGENGDCIGLEDPDIWIDDATGLLHLYFTLPIKQKDYKHISIHLGHAVGPDIHSLVMTEPILLDSGHGSAKELSIAPLNSAGFRYNLIESNARGRDFMYSTVRVAITRDMGERWEFGETIFNPEDHAIPWIGGHASPGPLFPKSFIDVGEHKLLGIMNGREANQRVDGKTKYGMFSAGLFIYDYERGVIDWVSSEPLIRDSEAITITFASQFVETEPGKGVLYAHVDDSFVRAYDLDAQKLMKLLPDTIKNKM